MLRIISDFLLHVNIIYVYCLVHNKINLLKVQIKVDYCLVHIKVDAAPDGAALDIVDVEAVGLLSDLVLQLQQRLLQPRVAVLSL